MGARRVKQPVHSDVRHGNHSLIVREPDFEAVVDLGNAAPLPGQLAVHKDQVAGLQVEPVVVVRQAPVVGSKIDLHHGPSGDSPFRLMGSPR